MSYPAIPNDPLSNSNRVAPVFIDNQLEKGYHYKTQRVFEFVSSPVGLLLKTNIGG